jgi:hypothetical protein
MRVKEAAEPIRKMLAAEKDSMAKDAATRALEQLK